MVYGEPVRLRTRGRQSAPDKIAGFPHCHESRPRHLVPHVPDASIATSFAPPCTAPFYVSGRSSPPGGRIASYARPAAYRVSPPRIPRGTRLLVRGDGDRPDGDCRPAGPEPRVLPRR